METQPLRVKRRPVCRIFWNVEGGKSRGRLATGQGWVSSRRNRKFPGRQPGSQQEALLSVPPALPRGTKTAAAAPASALLHRDTPEGSVPGLPRRSQAGWPGNWTELTGGLQAEWGRGRRRCQEGVHGGQGRGGWLGRQPTRAGESNAARAVCVCCLLLVSFPEGHYIMSTPPHPTPVFGVLLAKRRNSPPHPLVCRRGWSRWGL